MKVTEEQEKQIQKRLDETPYYGYCTEEYKEGIEDGAKWAIEKFGGIQWNKYPAVTPPQERTKVLVVMPDGSWREGIAKDGLLFVWLKNPGDWVQTLADYWAEINLPNQ